MLNPTNPEHAAIIDKLCESLAEMSIGSIVSYESLSQIAERDLRGKYRYLLASAIRKTESDVGCIYASVRGVGIKRLLSSEMPEHGLSVLRGIRRAARRGKKRIDRIKSNSLAPDEQRRIVGYSAMLGAVALIADGRRATAVAAVADPAKPIPPKNILEMFTRRD